MTFLIRDWQNPREYPYGFDGGNRYLKEVNKNERNIEEIRKTRENLILFKNLNCFVMPNLSNNIIGRAEFRLSGILNSFNF